MATAILRDLSYGRNGSDPPLALAENACTEAQNVILTHGRVAQKRLGCESVPLTSSTVTSGPRWLVRHVTTAGADELWMGDNGGATGVVARNPSGTGVWAPVSLPSTSDAPANSVWGRVRGASFNGKLFLAYLPTATTWDRTHVWDGTSLRRTGLRQPVAATVADTGSGTYTATHRWYKVAYTVQASGVTVRRSELSAAVGFTPSGSGTAARVTKPTALSEGETHWELYASDTTGLVYYKIATTAIATTTYDDSADPAAYTGDADPLVGTNTVIPACYYVLADESWLLWAREAVGTHTARVYYTAALGSTDVGDDERIPNTVDEQNWLDLKDNDGDPITGLAGPFYGSVLVFKRHAIWKLLRTGDATAPYRPVTVPSSVGALEQETICLGEDERGDQCVYFLSLHGPYRLGVNGLEYLGRDIEDVWATVNLANAGGDFHGVWYADRREVWWWVKTGSSTWKRLRLHVRSVVNGRGGWVVDTGDAATFGTNCSCLYLPGSLTSPPTTYVPYSGGRGVVLRHDTGTTDNGVLFKAYATSRPLALGGPGSRCAVDPVTVVAPVANASVSVTLTGDFGADTATKPTPLAAIAHETVVQRKLDACALGGAGYVQVTVGDTIPALDSWAVDAVILPTRSLDPR